MQISKILLPVEYTSSTTGHNQTFAILPTTCEGIKGSSSIALGLL
jgi:hypothetical protein